MDYFMGTSDRANRVLRSTRRFCSAHSKVEIKTVLDLGTMCACAYLRVRVTRLMQSRSLKLKNEWTQGGGGLAVAVCGADGKESTEYRGRGVVLGALELCVDSRSGGGRIMKGRSLEGLGTTQRHHPSSSTGGGAGRCPWTAFTI